MFWKQQKNMSVLADDDVILKYNNIWKKIKKLLSVEFDSKPGYDEKCIKTRAKTFEDRVITKFVDNEIPKENTKYSPAFCIAICIAATCIDSVMKLEKENYSQVNLEQCKFRIKKRKTLIYFMMN